MKFGATAAAGVALALVLSAPAAQRPNDSDASPKKKRAAMVHKPDIHYPLAAKQARLTGAGIIVVSIDPGTGVVTNATMGKSTGHAILDRAATDAFRQARFRPGSPPLVKIPINFTLTGGQFYEVVDVKKKNMDDVLAHFLGKGTVLKGPIPAYPRRPAWTDKSGKGVYELHADKDGKVNTVKILKSSGDATFDRETVRTLGKWRLRRGRPLILELPLRFTLTPTNYSVDVGR